MMWVLRRAVNSTWIHGTRLRVPRACCATSGILSDDLEHGRYTHEHDQFITIRRLSLRRLSHNQSVPVSFFVRSRSFSSQAGTESSGDEDKFSVDTPLEPKDIGASNADENSTDDLLSKAENFYSGDDAASNSSEASHDGLGLSKDEMGISGGDESRKRKSSSQLLKLIVDTPQHSIQSALGEWFEEGNRLGRIEISFVLFNLRKRRLFERALKFLETVEHSPDLDERVYASQLDLIAKVRGLKEAEVYINKIPVLFQGEVVYKTLLANCATALNVRKAEEVLNKMRDLGFPLSTFSCNQLLSLYTRFDRTKIFDLLLMMEKEHVNPTHFTYQLLLDAKGYSDDIVGMEQVFETMKTKGIEPGVPLQATVVRYYIASGLNEKAEALLKEMEGENIKENRAACKTLLQLYAALGNADEVSRIWEVCELRPLLEECSAAIAAWGKLGQIEKAEAVFENMIKTFKRLPPKHYVTLLNVYADHKLLGKGKDLAKRMSDDGCNIGPATWDALVKLYLGAGEVEKAESILDKAVGQNPKQRPWCSSYMALLDKYAERGDIHNAEKMFHRLRQHGYACRIQQYKSLLQAYVNAKAPVYGFRERMKADKMFPNATVALQLAQVDAFGKTQNAENAFA